MHDFPDDDDDDENSKKLLCQPNLFISGEWLVTLSVYPSIGVEGIRQARSNSNHNDCSIDRSFSREKITTKSHFQTIWRKSLQTLHTQIPLLFPVQHHGAQRSLDYNFGRNCQAGDENEFVGLG